jgi:hypothetical protein
MNKKTKKNLSLSVRILGAVAEMTAECNAELATIIGRADGDAPVLDYLGNADLMEEAIERLGVKPFIHKAGGDGFVCMFATSVAGLYCTPKCESPEQALATTLIFLACSRAVRDHVEVPE